MVKTYKILMCGPSRAGKSSIIEKLISDSSTDVYCPTVEDTYNFSVETDRHTKEKIRIFDLGGDQLGSTMCNIEKHYVSSIDALIIVHDLGNPESFKIVELIKKEVDRSRDRREIMMIVICNKRDIVDQKKIDNDPLYKWATKEKGKLKF